MNIHWNAKEYQNNFSFVPHYGEDVLRLIDAPEGSLVIDLGSGSGVLTQKLAQRGYRTIGIDASEEMTALARKSYPHLSFVTADAATFSLTEKADVIFSNAVFHWIDDQNALLYHIACQLKPGGILVFEFGGKGCAEQVHAALEKSFEKRGLSYRRVFFFPTIGEYAPLLEKHGFCVEFAALFDRPTPQKNENGLAEWIKMFVKEPFDGIGEALKTEIIDEVTRQLKPTLYHEGIWYIDYVRIRMKARRLP